MFTLPPNPDCHHPAHHQAGGIESVQWVLYPKLLTSRFHDAAAEAQLQQNFNMHNCMHKVIRDNHNYLPAKGVTAERLLLHEACLHVNHWHSYNIIAPIDKQHYKQLYFLQAKFEPKVSRNWTIQLTQYNEQPEQKYEVIWHVFTAVKTCQPSCLLHFRIITDPYNTLKSDT